MRIGILSTLDTYGGGLYQHGLNILHALDLWKREGCEDEFVLFVMDRFHPVVAEFENKGWTVLPFYASLKEKGWHTLKRYIAKSPYGERARWFYHKLKGIRTNPLVNPAAVRFNPVLNRWLHYNKIDLMFYATPTTDSFEARVPYVSFIMDLQHRLQPHFPEVSVGGQWEGREYMFRNTIRYATLLFVDSDAGKDDVLSFYGSYGAREDRIKVLPYLPAHYLPQNVTEGEKLRVKNKYSLPERYMFYPAQFWPHKNHAVIIQALERLRRVNDVKIPVVFCGSHTGEIRENHFRFITNMGRYCGVADQIHYLGYVPDEDMGALYAGAVALVMPTFFGPANIPYLEAWAFECPVITSDIRGIREQIGEAGILVDPHSPQAWADAMLSLWTNENMRVRLREKGRDRLKAYTPEEYRSRLIDIVEEAKKLVRLQGHFI